MKKNRLFLFLSKTVRIFTKPYNTVFQGDKPDEPCVYIVNHAGAVGPVDMCAKFYARDRTRIWCNNGMMERKEVPAYVRQDYWWKPGCLLEPVFTRTIPYIAALLVPPVLKSAPTIPVYHDQRVMLTLRESIKTLKSNQNVVIFPEQPSGWRSHETRINMGWIKLCELWVRTTGRKINICPVYIDTDKHVFHIFEPIIYSSSALSESEETQIAGYLASCLRNETNVIA